MVINHCVLLGSVMFKSSAMLGKAGNNASMVNATIDIKDAINATNSFLKAGLEFCILQN